MLIPGVASLPTGVELFDGERGLDGKGLRVIRLSLEGDEGGIGGKSFV